MPNIDLVVEPFPVFRALADPTRCRAVERLAAGPASMSDLARPFSMALPSFAQHMSVLEGAGLVVSEKVGRVRSYQLSPGGLRPAEDWLASLHKQWAVRLDQLDTHLRQMKGTKE
jgi:DNA-binding transcriptional ArsR family regulator